MNYSLLIKLLCAHVVADFVLQNKSFCARKLELNTWKGWRAQIAHALIQATMAYVFVWDWNNWIVPVVIFLSHLLIDVLKARYGRNNNPWHFVGDQLAHLIVILALFCGLEHVTELPTVNITQLMLLLTAYLLITIPASLFISMFYKQWEIKNQKKGSKPSTQSLPRGGEYIGMLERVLLLTFIFAGYPEGIGFLLAAKSIFRFGDLQRTQELQQTEYVLIGTFLSFTIAIVVGYVAVWAMKLIA